VPRLLSAAHELTERVAPHKGYRMSRLDCLSSSLHHRLARRGRPGRLTRWFLTAVLVAVPGCREDPQSPTAVESSPALATTAATPLAFFQLSAGDGHTCGLTTDNRAYCWGANDLGQFGNGSTTTPSLTPVAVGGGLQFRQISAGHRATCAVGLSRRAYCWGSNFSGELGDGSTTDRHKPTLVAGGHLFRMVETTVGHTCGVSYPDSRVYCWGENFDGELGDGTRTDRHKPIAVVSTLAFRQVTVGYHHTCGATNGDQAYCWGRNQFGQVGDTSRSDRRVKPFLVSRTLKFHQLDAGPASTCGVTTDTRAFCWGDGRFGQLGNGGQAVAFAPKAVAGGLHFTRVSAGDFYTCGETGTDRAYCWGRLLDEATGFTVHPAPVALPGGLSFAQVSAGANQACGKTSVSVGYCWGGNFNGEFGDGTTTSSSTPQPVAGPM
jgi:alpha-tubulin suppressor-like RCC1 family protein